MQICAEEAPHCVRVDHWWLELHERWSTQRLLDRRGLVVVIDNFFGIELFLG
jgi:hypothetical protein